MRHIVKRGLRKYIWVSEFQAEECSQINVYELKQMGFETTLNDQRVQERA